MTTWREMASRDRYARMAELAKQRIADNDNGVTAARRMEGERRHLEHEAYWLAKERERYGTGKLAKPLSRMIA